MKRILLGAMAAIAVLTPVSSASATAVTVHVGQGGHAFTPPDVTIASGQTVHWTWDSSGHSVTSGSPAGTPDGRYDSGVQNQGSSFDHTYATPGVYHYFCSVHYAEGMVGTVTVTDRPVASFTTSPASASAGHSAAFDASASSDPGGSPIVSYTWSFGDGVTQTTSSPTTTHLYGAKGSFKVGLVVTDAAGDASPTTTHTVKVAADVPKAAFTAEPAKPTVGTSVSFDGSASRDADGDAIVSYRWSFGDGAIHTTSRPASAHVYGTAGTFTAMLTVVDSLGNVSGPASHSITVVAPTPPVAPPVARFRFAPGHPLAGRAVSFDAAVSTASSGRTLTSYRWAFGDGSLATGPAAQVTHAFAHPGSYAARLVVVDSKGARSSTAIHVITVLAAPVGPRVSDVRVKACPRRSARCPRRGVRIRFALSSAGRVVITLTRRHHLHPAKRITVAAGAGSDSVHLRFAHKHRGRYVVNVHAVSGTAADARFFWRVR